MCSPDRPGKLQDILAVERELARVREEIERYEGRLRYLKSRAATSRLTLSVHEPVPVLEQTGQSPLVDAVRQAWGRFLGLVDPCDRLVWRRDSGGIDRDRCMVDAASSAPSPAPAGIACFLETT